MNPGQSLWAVTSNSNPVAALLLVLLGYMLLITLKFRITICMLHTLCSSRGEYFHKGHGKEAGILLARKQAVVPQLIVL